MILNKALLATANQSWSAIFNQALVELPREYQRYAMTVQSSGSSESYAFMGRYPSVKRWISDREFAHLTAYKFALENLDWNAGIEVDRNDIEDDRLGLYGPQIRQLVRAGNEHYHKLIIDLLVGGFTGLAYDGQYFFDTDHTWGSNKGTAALATGSLEAAMIAMMQFKVEGGGSTDYLNIRPTHLVVPPQLGPTARAIVEAEYLASGATNVNAGLVELIVEPFLAGHPTKWFLMSLNQDLKPFILQIRRAWTFIAQDDPAIHEQAFMRKFLRYSIDGRHNAGYGMPMLAWGSDGTT